MLKYLNSPKFLLCKKLWRVNIKMNKGMTLIEVLVVVAIIAIISSIVIVNPRPQTNLNIAAQQLVSDLRRAQNMAMAAEVRTVPCVHVPCSYGINFNTTDTFYTLFKDIGGLDCTLVPPEIICPGNNQIDVGEDIKTIFLPEGIEIGVIKIGTEIENSSNAIFLCPFGVRPTPDDITITLRRKDKPTDSKNVKITGDGNIEIE